MTYLAAALLALTALQDLTKEDVLKLTKEGAAEAFILKKMGSSKFTLGADDVVELKKAGVGEKVLARMLSGPSELRLQNLSHRGVTLKVEGRDLVMGLGDQYPPGTRVELPASGDFALYVPGRGSSMAVKTPAMLTVRGCNVEKFEVVTLYVETPSGTDTCFLDLNVKPVVEPVYLPAGPPLGTSRVLGGGFLEGLWDCIGSIGSIF